MFSEGLVLLVMGMGIVYAFLYLMVLVMRAVAVVVPRFNHLMPDGQTQSRPVRAVPAADEGAAVAAAVAALLARRRS